MIGAPIASQPFEPVSIPEAEWKRPLCTPAGEPLSGGSALEEPDEQADQRDATGVAKAPVEAQPPRGVLFAACGEGCQRGQVVRPADHVSESRRKTDE